MKFRGVLKLVTLSTFFNSAPPLKLPPLDTYSNVCSAVPNDEPRLTSMISPDDKLKKYPSSNSSSSPNELKSQSLVIKIPAKNLIFIRNVLDMQIVNEMQKILCTYVYVNYLLATLQSRQILM